MKNSDCTFTFGIPVYNGMKYLPQTIDSVLAQTRSDFEVLIVDDGSTDDTAEYLKTIRDRRFHVVHQSNRGLTATLNRMIKLCPTPWLVRLDADDLARPERIEVLSKSLNQNPNAGMFYSDAGHCGFTSRVSQARITKGSPAELLGYVRQGRLLSFVHSSVALNVEKVQQVGGYRFNLHVEDLDLWWRMALRNEIHYIPETTIDYRLNAGSVCRTNLRQLTLNTLFVQYLLLSHLWNLSARPYEDAIKVLAEFVDERWLEYRDNMWNSAIEETNGNHLRAMRLAAMALIVNPRKFFERALHGTTSRRAHTVGTDPRRFWKARDQLWSEIPRSLELLEFALL